MGGQGAQLALWCRSFLRGAQCDGLLSVVLHQALPKIGLGPHLMDGDCLLERLGQHSLHRAVHSAQGTQGCLELLLLSCALLLGGRHCSQQLPLSHQGSALVLGKSVAYNPEDLLDHLVGAHLRADVGPLSLRACRYRKKWLLPCLRQQPIKMMQGSATSGGAHAATCTRQVLLPCSQSRTLHT